MSNDKAPSYIELFGNLDIKSGDKGRTVFSPAAYFVDLMQLKEKQNEKTLEEIDIRRPDISGIPLNSENTFTEIPYLDIVNDVLDDKISLKVDENKTAYDIVKTAKYPFNLDFDVDYERSKLVLEYHKSDIIEFYKKFIANPDSIETAKKYLGITNTTYSILTESKTSNDDLKPLWGLEGESGTVSNILKEVSVFVKKARLSGVKFQELLFQNLSDEEKENGLAANFYINNGTKYIKVNSEIDPEIPQLELSDGSAVTNQYYDRIHRFIRLSIITKWDFIELDLVLRTACNNVLNENAIQIIAAIKYLQEYYKLSIDVLCAFWADIKNRGDGETSIPEHLFYAVYDKGYNVSILDDSLNKSINNSIIRNRILASLELKEKELQLLLDNLDSYLFEQSNTQKIINLNNLSILYRFKKISSILELSIEEFFTLLGIIDRMWEIQEENKFEIYIPLAEKNISYLEILAGSNQSKDVKQVLWLLQTLTSIVEWLNYIGMTVDQLAFLFTNDITDYTDGILSNDERDDFFTDIADQFQNVLLQPVHLQSGIINLFSANNLFDSLSKIETGIITDKGVIKKIPEIHELTKIIEDIIFQKNILDINDFTSLTFDQVQYNNLIGELELNEYIDANQLFTNFGINYLIDTENINNFAIDGFDELNEEIFTILNNKVKRINGELENVGNEAEELAGKLQNKLEQQGQALFGSLESSFQVNTDILKILCRLVYTTLNESEDAVIHRFISPLLTAYEEEDINDKWMYKGEILTSFHRLQQYILLVKKVQLTAEQLQVLLDKERYIEYIPEKLNLPSDFTSDIDASYFNKNNNIFITKGDRCIEYDGIDYSIKYQGKINEHEELKNLVTPFKNKIDTAFLSNDRRVFLFSGKKFLYISDQVSSDQDIAKVWGRVENHIIKDKTIDAAYTAKDGKTYLFRKDQYVRYTDASQEYVDEGYPKKIADNWNNEGNTRLPSAFFQDISAVFIDTDNTDYFFAGNNFITSLEPKKFKEIKNYWGIVLNHIASQSIIDAGIVIDGKTYLFRGNQYVRYSDSGGYGFVDVGYPRTTMATWENEGLGNFPAGIIPANSKDFEGFDAGFQGADNNVYFFISNKFFVLKSTAGLKDIKEVWGKVLNNLKSLNRVDAAFYKDGKTYLFTGDQYTRYDGELLPGADTFYVTESYPRKIKDNWNALENIGTLTETFENGISAAFTSGDQTSYFFSADKFISSKQGALESVINEYWAIVRNNIKIDNKVDAALTFNNKLYLFSSDQFYCYSNDDNEFVDEGYPLSIAGNWKNEGNWSELPASFHQGISAGFTDANNKVYLFSGNNYVSSDNFSLSKPIFYNWGRVKNNIQLDKKVDAGFVTPDGKAYIFSNDQYYLYSTDDYTYVDEGYPKKIKGNWGNLPDTFDENLDAAFMFYHDGKKRLYLFSGDKFARYSDNDFATVDVGYPKLIKDGDNSEGEWFKGFIDYGFDPHDHDFERPYRIDAVYIDEYNNKDQINLFYSHKYTGQQHYKKCYYSTSAKKYKWTNPYYIGDMHLHPFAFIDAAFYTPDRVIYYFFNTQYRTFIIDTNQLTDPVLIKDKWGKVENKLVLLKRVDASYLSDSGKVYLFTDDHYIRYSGEIKPGQEDFYIDEGYPKNIKNNWNNENSGVAMPDVFKNTGYAVSCYNNETHVFIEGEYYSTNQSKIPLLDRWAKIKNRIKELNRVDAAYVAGNGKTYLFCDNQYIRYSLATLSPEAQNFYVDEGYPKTISTKWNLEGNNIDFPEAFQSEGFAIFRDALNKTYLFSNNTYKIGNNDSHTINEHWGIVRNNIRDNNFVDAGFVYKNDADKITYIFSGDQYVKYSNGYDKEVDEGYPKTIAGNWQNEMGLVFPDPFNNKLDAAFHGIDDKIYFFNETQYVNSEDPAEIKEVNEKWGIVRNLIQSENAVDAAYTSKEGKTYLFSGDQYTRYSGKIDLASSEFYSDEGFPQPIANFGINDGIELPALFHNKMDAVFKNKDGRVYYISGSQYVDSDNPGDIKPLEEGWGKVENDFTNAGKIDAAGIAPDGKIYLFCNTQYVCYSSLDNLDTEDFYVDQGYPKKVKNNLGIKWPQKFQDNIDSMFLLDGRTYIFKDDEYIRFSDPLCLIPDILNTDKDNDEKYILKISDKWTDLPVIKLNDVVTFDQFKVLSNTYVQLNYDLLKYFNDSNENDLDSAKDNLCMATEWDKTQLEFLLNTQIIKNTDILRIQTLYDLNTIFYYSEKLRSLSNNLKTEVWDNLFKTPADYKKSADILYGLLKAKVSQKDWDIASTEMHNIINVKVRDVFMPYYMFLEDFETTRELYEHLLLDIEMSECATSSKLKEAICTSQLFYHRTLMNLDELENNNEANLKKWWPWMKNYRVWEANRKVFLYPENYIRPELRTNKSPSFKKLEEELLQTDIDDLAVAKAYNNYINEYSEVSSLIISGGYVYSKDDETYAIMFGFARTEPLKYYYRIGKVGKTSEDPIAWEPWIELGITINAERVYPVYAFNRIFVFWVEAREVNDTEFSGGGRYSSKGTKITYNPVINYSFYDLNKEWIAPQELISISKYIDEENPEKYITYTKEQLDEAGFYVTNPTLSTDQYNNQEYIYIVYQFSGNNKNNRNYPYDFTFSGRFTSELDLYTIDQSVVDTILNTRPEFPKDRFGLSPLTSIYWTTHFEDTLSAPWYSFNDKGGNFLCKPYDITVIQASAKQDSKYFTEAFDGVDAGFVDEDAKLFYLFHNEKVNGVRTAKYITFDPATGQGSTPMLAKNKWNGITIPANVFDSGTKVNYGFVLFDKTYLFTENNYFMHYMEDEYDYIDGYDYLPIPSNFDVVSLFPEDREQKTWDEFKTLYLETGAKFFNNLTGIFKYGNNVYLYIVEDNGQFVYTITTPGNIISFMPNGIFPTEVVPAPTPTDPNHTTTVIKRWNNFNTVFLKTFKDDDIEILQIYFTNGSTVNYFEYNFGDESEEATSEWKTDSLTDLWNLTGITTINAGFKGHDGNIYLFSNDKFACEQNDFAIESIKDKWGKICDIADKRVDAAFVNSNNNLYLFSGNYAVVFESINSNNIIDGPKKLSDLIPGVDPDFRKRVNSAFILPLKKKKIVNDEVVFEEVDKLYLFCEDKYLRCKLETGFPLDDGFTGPKNIKYNWGNLLGDFNTNIDAGFTAVEIDESEDPPVEKRVLYLFNDGNYVKYTSSEVMPYEISEVYYDILRMTSNTAQKLAQRLFAGGVDGLLNLSTQTTSELPKFVIDTQANRKSGKYSELDTIFYKEDYIIRVPGTDTEEAAHLEFDSANGSYYWEIFFHTPFLISMALNQSQKFTEAQKWYHYIFDPTAENQTGNERPHWKFLPFNIQAEDTSLDFLDDLTQLYKYRDDPFDPHGIAALRQVAYRKAIVMNYIDNLLDWGDMLFTQYTRETINEARMLYVLGYDLLGKKPENLGLVKLTPALNYYQLYNEFFPETFSDVLLQLENDPANVELPAGSGLETPNDSIANPYFYIPENDLFVDYWDRVEDRLYKIRHCLNIEGIKQPLPLFQPPIDPMALVRAMAGGGGFAQALAMFNISVPHYRFNFMLAKAKELTSRLTQLGGTLLSTLEKKDAEELSLLRNTQERNILKLTLKIKEDQLKNAEESLLSLKSSLKNAEERQKHYNKLLSEGLSNYETNQLTMMITAKVFSSIAQVMGIISSIGSFLPQAGSPFAITYGGEQIGNGYSGISTSMNAFADAFNFASNLNSVLGGWARRAQDWGLQKKLAGHDVTQIGHQIAGAEIQVKIARQDIQVQEKQIEQNESIENFMKNKFTNKQLYQWMISKITGLFFQTYQMALDYARAAQRAFQFEMGYKESEVDFIRGAYWDSLKKGLLSGEQLQLDLDRMEKAYVERNKRRFEISKTVSLMELDPLALLNLKQNAECEFNLSEALYDYDFPGHYCRQIKTISISFPAVIGQYDNFNATLTQLSHKTIIEPDKEAVKFLINPVDEMPLSIRADWRMNQQIALSRSVNDSGLFQLNFQDERYLPFEGTGAVSSWRLEINGYKGAIELANLSDVIIKVDYTALQGGETFANQVKKELKPVTVAKVFNLAQDFENQWKTFLHSEDKEMNLELTRDLFPNMSKYYVTSIYMQYDLTEQGQSQLASKGMQLKYNDEDDAIELKHTKFVDKIGNDPLSLAISSSGVTWKLTPSSSADKFNAENIRNIAFVFEYTAKVNF